jgi:DUF4097 and DUF4098 domain-containing protein YvlB
VTPMMHCRFPIPVFVAFVSMAQAEAALTNGLPGRDDTPRSAWFDRYAEARQGPEQTDRVTQTIKVGADGALDLTNISGDVRVTGTSGSAITIEAVKRVRHRDGEEAKRLLQELRVDITNVGDRVEVRTTYPRRNGGWGGERNSSARVDYTIGVPIGASVAVKTVSGDASVTKVNGEVRAETVSGNVMVTGTPNLAVAKTVSGNVTAKDVEGAANLSLGTVSGTVVASGLKARSLECGSVSGDIQLAEIQVERLVAKSVSGSIEFGTALTRGGRYDIGSHSGDIRIVLASQTGFELDASTFSGSVRSDFPVTMRADGGSRDRRDSNRSIRGSFGDSSAVLSLKTFSGAVVITRK